MKQLLLPRRPKLQPARSVPRSVRPEHGWAFNSLGVTIDDCMSPRAKQLLGLDILRGQEVQSILRRHYPGHPWIVEVNHEQQIIKIMIKHLHERPYVVLLRDFYADPRRDCIMRAGGEFLERFNIPRAGFSETDFYTAVEAMKSPARRNLAPPEDLRSDTQRRREEVKQIKALDAIIRPNGEVLPYHRSA